MYPRTNYEMTDEDLKVLLDACKPTPVMFLSGGIDIGGSPQENANIAWKELGNKYGFDYMTVRPVHGKGQRFFTAVPNETEEQKKERVKVEAAAKKKADIEMLETEIQWRQEKLNRIKAEE